MKHIQCPCKIFLPNAAHGIWANGNSRAVGLCGMHGWLSLPAAVVQREQAGLGCCWQPPRKCQEFFLKPLRWPMCLWFPCGSPCLGTLAPLWLSWIWEFHEKKVGFMGFSLLLTAFKNTFLVASGEPCLAEQGLPCGVPPPAKPI